MNQEIAIIANAEALLGPVGDVYVPQNEAPLVGASRFPQVQAAEDPATGSGIVFFPDATGEDLAGLALVGARRGSVKLQSGERLSGVSADAIFCSVLSGAKVYEVWRDQEEGGRSRSSSTSHIYLLIPPVAGSSAQPLVARLVGGGAARAKAWGGAVAPLRYRGGAHIVVCAIDAGGTVFVGEGAERRRLFTPRLKVLGRQLPADLARYADMVALPAAIADGEAMVEAAKSRRAAKPLAAPDEDEAVPF